MEGGCEQPFCVQFLERTSHGVLCGVRVEPPRLVFIPSTLTHQEMWYCRGLSQAHRNSWIAGRIALRVAAKQMGILLPSVFSTCRGAPRLPKYIVGSIAHKRRLAVALVQKQMGQHVGVDLEELYPVRDKIAKLILRSEEAAFIDQAPTSTRWEQIIRIFSIKEAIFKALDPMLMRYIGFHEACVDLQSLPQVDISLHLKHNEGPFALQGRCVLAYGHIISSVQACLRHSK